MNQAAQKYLEAILILSMQQEDVRAIDLARKLQVTRASVCRALKQLEQSNYIQLDIKKCIKLTPQGKEKAQHIYDKQKLIETFLSKVIEVPSDIAQKEASYMKHHISEEVTEGLRNFLLVFLA